MQVKGKVSRSTGDTKWQTLILLTMAEVYSQHLDIGIFFNQFQAKPLRGYQDWKRMKDFRMNKKTNPKQEIDLNSCSKDQWGMGTIIFKKEVEFLPSYKKRGVSHILILNCWYKPDAGFNKTNIRTIGYIQHDTWNSDE